MRLIVAVILLVGGVSGIPRLLSQFWGIDAMQAIGHPADQTHFEAEVLVL